MKILITGGAGFIGSNIIKMLLEEKTVSKIKILDNLSTGYLSNIEEYLINERVEFINGDIRDLNTCIESAKGMDVICHQAALGSVPRSIEDPITSHNVNVNGFINILEAAKANNIIKVVYASSSAVYGDLNDSPKVEYKIGKVLSPYASTKLTNEIYAESYSRNYNLNIIGFRYFNVFGPNQDPTGPYAAVIPIFINCALADKRPVINGDGTITRDFTPVANVVQINIRAIFKEAEIGKHEVYNVACGGSISLNEIWNKIKNITGTDVNPIYGPNRKGDILFSLADIEKAKSELGYKPMLDIESAIEGTVFWYNQKFNERGDS